MAPLSPKEPIVAPWGPTPVREEPPRASTPPVGPFLSSHPEPETSAAPSRDAPRDPHRTVDLPDLLDSYPTLPVAIPNVPDPPTTSEPPSLTKTGPETSEQNPSDPTPPDAS